MERIVKIRKRCCWGARKIRRKLQDDATIDRVPSADTIHRILVKEELVDHRKPRCRCTHPGPPLPIPPEPDATWTADFEGEFRTDNGHPFATTAIAGLSQLSVWWIELGILPDLIEPSQPQQNGRHERLHRTLKEGTASPPAGNLRAQQTRFNRFRRIYNHERPHEALRMETPASAYQPSPRPFTERPEPLEYPGHFELRLVAGDNTLRWRNRKVFVSSLLERKLVGLEPVADDAWAVYFGPVRLGWLHEHDYRIMDVLEPARRCR